MSHFSEKQNKIFQILLLLKYVGDWIQHIIHYSDSGIDDIRYWASHDHLNCYNTWKYYKEHKYGKENIQDIIIVNNKSITPSVLQNIYTIDPSLSKNVGLYYNFLIIVPEVNPII